MEAVITNTSNATMRTQIALRERIFNGHFAPGTRLREVQIAEELGVSRTPLREAFARLEQEGLLERVGGAGFAVRRFTIGEAADAIKLRGALEGLAVLWAAERGVSTEHLEEAEDVLAKLDRIINSPSADIDIDAYSVLNARFHGLLIDMCGSRLLALEIERVTGLPFASPTAFLHGPANILEFSKSLPVAQSQHRSLIEAIKARQGARAEALAREHANVALSNLYFAADQDENVLKSLPGLSLVSNTKEL